MHVIILQVHYELIRSIGLHCPTHGGRQGEDEGFGFESTAIV